MLPSFTSEYKQVQATKTNKLKFEKKRAFFSQNGHLRLAKTKITQVASCSLKYFNKPEIIQKDNTQNSSKI